MTEHIKLIKAKELKIGDVVLECGCFWEVKDIEQKETSITVCYQFENARIHTFWDKDELLAIKTHCQKEDTEPDEQEDTTNPSHYTQGEYEVIQAKYLQDGDLAEIDGVYCEIENVIKENFKVKFDYKNGSEDGTYSSSNKSTLKVKRNPKSKGTDAVYKKSEDTINIKLNRLMTEHFEDFLIENIFKYMYKWQRDNSIENLKTTKSYMDELIKLWSDDKCF